MAGQPVEMEPTLQRGVGVLYEHVSIDSVAHVDAPVRLPSSEIVRRLRPACERLQIAADVLLEEVAGIRERRLWVSPTRVADAATMAAREGAGRLRRPAGPDRRPDQHVGVPRLSWSRRPPRSSTAPSACRTAARTSTWATPAWPS